MVFPEKLLEKLSLYGLIDSYGTIIIINDAIFTYSSYCNLQVLDNTYTVHALYSVVVDCCDNQQA